MQSNRRAIPRVRVAFRQPEVRYGLAGALITGGQESDVLYFVNWEFNNHSTVNSTIILSQSTRFDKSFDTG